MKEKGADQPDVRQVLQAAVEVFDADTPETLSERILEQEHRIYSEAIHLILSGRCVIEGRRVVVRG